MTANDCVTPTDSLSLAAFRSRVAQLRSMPATQIRGALAFAARRPGSLCWLCSRAATLVEAVVPERAGGRLVYENLAPACATCRRDRGALDVLEWLEAKRRTPSDAQHSRLDEALAAS